MLIDLEKRQTKQWTSLWINITQRILDRTERIPIDAQVLKQMIILHLLLRCPKLIQIEN